MDESGPGKKYRDPFADEAIVARIDRMQRGIPELSDDPDSVAALQIFAETLKPSTSVIYYPGSGSDNSPSKVLAFKDSKIIYADTYEPCIRALEEAGYEAHLEDAATYNPGQVDILLMRDFFKEEPLNYVVDGGYVVTGDFWKCADLIHDREDYILIGVLHKDEASKKYELDADHPEKYLEDVKTDEEFEREARESGTWEQIEEVIKKYGDPYLTPLAAYREIIKKSKKSASGLGFIDEGGGKLFPIPRKITRSGDVFVFQKKEVA